MIVNLLDSGLDVLVRTDFATTAFVCDGSNLLEPTVQKTGVITGNGSVANPLGIETTAAAGFVLTSNGIGQATFQSPVAGAQTPITTVDDTCVTITASGTNNHTLTPALVLNPVATNQVSCTATGLLVPKAAGLTVTDTTCINLDITNGDLSASPVISPAISARNNSLSCTATGLFAPEAQFSASNTCALGGVGATFMIREITDIGNNQFRVNGAPEHTCSSVGAAYTGFVENQALNTAGTRTSLTSATAVLNNPSACRPMKGLLIGSLEWNIEANNNTNYSLAYQQSVNGGAFSGMGQVRQILMNSTYHRMGHQHMAIGQLDEFAVLPPAGTLTVRLRLGVVVAAVANPTFNTWFGSSLGIRMFGVTQ